MAYPQGVFQVPLDSVHGCLGGQQDLAVLLYKLGEVGEQRMLATEEIELVVPLLAHHELVEELGSVPRHELGREFHHV